MKNKQRGGFDVITLVMYGAIALAAIGLIAGANNALKHHYVDPEQIEWDKEKARLNSDKATLSADKTRALEANASLESQFETFRNVHNAQVKAWSDAYDEALKKRGGRDKEIESLRAQVAMDKFNYIVALGKPDGGFTCDQLDAVLLEEAKRKVKYYGGANSATTPAAAPAASGLRVVEPETAAPRRTNPLSGATK